MYLTSLRILNIDVKAKVALTPHLGVAWDPGKRWHLTATVHAPQKLEIVSDFTILLVRGDHTLSVSGLVHYQRWSKYIDRQSMRPEGSYAWRDTLTGALGLRTKNGPVSLGLDGQYKSTPVPQQTGRTNYVDNDRLGVSACMEYTFAIAGLDFAIGAQVQLYRLLERSVRKRTPPTKDGVNRTPELVWDEVPDDAVRGGKPVDVRDGLQTNNPGWPGYSSRGWVSSGGAFLSHYM